MKIFFSPPQRAGHPLQLFCVQLLLATILLFGGLQAQAGEVEVVQVEIRCNDDTCNFNVTLRHEDEGWEHYADEWKVQTIDGKVLANRVLLHPHVDEQPFTRSRSSLHVPLQIEEVEVCARDNLHGWAKSCKRVGLGR